MGYPIIFALEEVFGLPNIKSAKKRVLVAKVRNARNKAEKSALRTAMKKFEVAATEAIAPRPRALTRSR